MSPQTEVLRLEAAKCVLPNLKADSIRRWGLAVQGYEMTHGFYERRLISKEVKDTLRVCNLP